MLQTIHGLQVILKAARLI